MEQNEAAEDFWSNATSLFELADSIGEQLEISAMDEDLRSRLHRLADALPHTPEPLTEMDPYLRSAMLTAVIHALVAESNDNRSEVRLAVERLRQALRDVVDEHPVWRAGPRHAAMWLREQGLTVHQLAEVLAVSEATVRRWTSSDEDVEPSGENADRLVVIAKIVNHLRHAMTPRGTVQWLLRPHPGLEDRRPVDELKDPDSYRRVVHLASGSRSFVAT